MSEEHVAEGPPWRQQLLQRLERGLARKLTSSDHHCIVWNAGGQSLTVESPPLLTELRANNLISNVFRTHGRK